ncbi:MAG TPA: hypothetical protein DD738_12790 [Ruminiclostridium sp.]|nr:hypothetical protein [Ruminiclostridium sp.]
MKKFVIKLLVALILLTVIFYTVYTYPREFNKECKGILYRLGDSDKNYTKEVTVKFDGIFSKDFIFGYHYIGDIFVDNFKVKINEVKFDKYNKGHLEPYYDENTDETVNLGMIIVDSNFSKLIIAVHDILMITENESHYKWSTGDGLVIAAPAENRIEALNITKELLSKYLHIPEANFK